MPNNLYLRILKLLIFWVLTTALVILIAVWHSTSQTVHKNIFGSLNYVKASTEEHLYKLSQTNSELLRVAIGEEFKFEEINNIKNELEINFIVISLNGDLKILSDDFQSLTNIEANSFELNSDLQLFYLNKDKQLYFVNTLALNQGKTQIFHGYKIDKAWIESLKAVSGLNLSVLTEQQQSTNITTISDQAISAASLQNGKVSESYLDLFKPAVFFGFQTLFTNEIPLQNIIGQKASIYLSINAERVSDNFLKLQTTIGLVALLCVLVASVFGFFTSKRITRPIELLTAYASRIANGDYRANTPPKGLSSEFKSLFNTFEQMKQNVEVRESEILYRSLHDSVTPLHNREFVKSFVASKFEQAQNFQVVIVHILNFRHINDVFGNEFGDACLVRFANRMLTMTGKSARYSGAEFLWFPDISHSTEDLLQTKAKLENTFVENGIRVNLKVTMAKLDCPEDAQSKEQFFKRLAILSDISQSEPKIIQSFSIDIENAYFTKLRLVSELSHEIDIDCANFKVVYQPYKGLHQQSRYRAEALLRWESEKLGKVGPDVFIPLAEEIGVINKVTQWVIKQVVSDIKLLKQKNIECEISINISSQDLFDENFFSLLEQISKNTEVDNTSISFELTESVLVNDVEKARNIMQAIKRLGFKLALDDFGTGYSSLAYLSTLPVDTIKLDHAFIKDLSVSLDKRTLSKRIMQIAADYNMELVAEGVEDKDSLTYLSEQSCEWAQGFYMSKPLVLEDVVQYFKEQVDKNV